MTPKQKAFIAAYAGNATEAARVAGYRGSDKVLGQTGHHLLKNREIAEAIAKRQEKREEKLVADRAEVETQLTAFFRNEKLGVRERLQALNLFSKMQGFNLTKVVLEGRVTWEQLIMQAERKTRGENGAGVVAQVEPSAGREAVVSGVEDSPRLPSSRAPGTEDDAGA